MNIKKYIPLQIKHKLVYYISNNKKYSKQYNKENKKIIIALAANYGNLGDLAITYAQHKFLKNNFKNYKVIEVPIDETYSSMKDLKRIINKDDIITIIGGGNFGNIYDDIERARQFFIKQFPKNKIVCFPQTIDFTNDINGKKALKKARKIYNNHKDLTLFAREKKSFKIMKENFNNKIYLVPDIVLSLNKQQPIESRENITICFRNDKENKISSDEKAELINKLNEIYKEKVIITDTHIGDVKVNEENRIDTLEKIWTTFRRSKVVITDRLHGMIFCAITGTPCIALPNSNGKIEETYENWLKDIPYIRFIKNVTDENLYKNIKEMLEMSIEIRVEQRDKEYIDIKNILKEH